MRPNLSPGWQSQRRLLVGLGTIALIFLVEDGAGTLLSRRANVLARNLYATSLASVEHVTRMAQAVDEERQLVNEHIFETDAAAMAEIERRLAGVARRLQQSQDAYVPLIDLPHEAALWQRVETSEATFKQGMSEVLALSRVNRNSEARARMVAVQRSHMDLDGLFIELTQLNLDGASEAMARIGRLQHRTEAVQWATGVAGLLVLLLVGIWGSRGIVRYENQITGYALEIEERNHDLDAFAGRVAHDLRNALGPILMAPLMLRKLPGIPQRATEIADLIQRCSNRAIAVLDALLAFSRASRKADVNESAALAPVLKSVNDELSSLAAQLEVTVEIPNVPDVHVRCNPGLLYIVLANLCGNAVKYLDGQKERRVRIATQQEGGLCRIDIQDTGPGIAKDVQERIFEPFFRVEGNQAPGTGIGLATVRRILDARGGRVAVQSEKGRGARFTVWLPLALPSEEHLG